MADRLSVDSSLALMELKSGTSSMLMQILMEHATPPGTPWLK
jgi:hypothetical protein